MESVRTYKWIYIAIYAYAKYRDFNEMNKLLVIYDMSDEEQLCAVRGTYPFRDYLKNWQPTVEKLRKIFDADEMTGL